MPVTPPAHVGDVATKLVRPPSYRGVHEDFAAEHHNASPVDQRKTPPAPPPTRMPSALLPPSVTPTKGLGGHLQNIGSPKYVTGPVPVGGTWAPHVYNEVAAPTPEASGDPLAFALALLAEQLRTERARTVAAEARADRALLRVSELEGSVNDLRVRLALTTGATGAGGL